MFYLTFTISCSSNHQEKKVNYSQWKQDFKDRTLEKCLLVGYEEKSLIQKINNIDRSIYNPIAITFFDDKIDFILKPVVLKMKIDSLKSLNKASEAKAGKNVFSTCLNFYNSKKLDSITKVEAKKWKKIKTNEIDSIISTKIPAY